jgi:UDP-GlcNAc:undecaprenyl-phosphate/decaprenyl-phosphate GlcNAc-1-phosphate transferase
MLFISMGIPLFDVIFSPIRRFFLGKGIFQPDKKHLHHKLLALGLSSRRVVLVLYGATILLCAAALLLVNLRSEQAGFLLIFLGLGAFFFLRSAGYFRSVEYRRFQSFFRDFSDMTGLSKARRNFLDLQLSIQSSPDVDVLWVNICNALEALDLDYAEITLSTADGRRFSLSSEFLPNLPSGNGNGFRRTWKRSEFVPETSLSQMHMLKLELPLRNKSHVSYGTLWLIKNLSRSPIDHYTLSRVEHLRRSIIRCLYGLGADSRA